MVNSCERRIIAVGALPNPIGGVSNFVLRLAGLNMVDEVWDLYPNDIKTSVPDGCSARFLKGFVSLYFLVLINAIRSIGNHYFFNFSTQRSLLLFLILPKGVSRFSLMLHHGNLSVGKRKFLYSMALRRFDTIYCLNASQFRFYCSLGVDRDRLAFRKSYLPPLSSRSFLSKKNISNIDQFFCSKGVLVCSGHPSSIYGHLWCIKFVTDNPQWSLALFLYGEGDELQQIVDASRALSNVRLFWDFNQFEFLYALGKAHAYVRPSKVDSFGVAVADAISLGVPVLASDVCERYPGCFIFTPSNYQSFKVDMEKFLDNTGKKVDGDVNSFCFEFASKP